MTSNDFWSAQLRARQIEEDTGISLADQAAMPLDEWSRLVHGRTPVQAALEAIGAQQPPATPQTAPEATQAPQDAPQGIDLANMDMATYAALRAELGIGQGRQEGIGLLSQPGSQSWAEAARRKAGRTAMGGREVHAVVPKAFVPEPARDTRSAAERFSTPGNSFQA